MSGENNDPQLPPGGMDVGEGGNPQDRISNLETSVGLLQQSMNQIANFLGPLAGQMGQQAADPAAAPTAQATQPVTHPPVDTVTYAQAVGPGRGEPDINKIPQYKMGSDVTVWLVVVFSILSMFSSLHESKFADYAAFGLIECGHFKWWTTEGKFLYASLLLSMSHWDAFCKVIKERFLDPNRLTKLYGQITSFKQRKFESIHSMFTRFHDLIRLHGGDWPDHIQREILKTAIWIKIRQSMSINWRTATPDEIKRDAASAEDQLIASGSIPTPKIIVDRSSIPSTSNNTDANGLPIDGITDMELGARGIERNRRVVKCWNCGRVGHPFSKCRFSKKPDAQKKYDEWKKHKDSANDKGKGPDKGSGN